MQQLDEINIQSILTSLVRSYFFGTVVLAFNFCRHLLLSASIRQMHRFLVLQRVWFLPIHLILQSGSLLRCFPGGIRLSSSKTWKLSGQDMLSNWYPFVRYVTESIRRTTSKKCERWNRKYCERNVFVFWKRAKLLNGFQTNFILTLCVHYFSCVSAFKAEAFNEDLAYKTWLNQVMNWLVSDTNFSTMSNDEYA